MTTVSLTCLCKKCTLSAVLISALTLHPLTGQYRSTATLRNNMGYIYGSLAGVFLPIAAWKWISQEFLVLHQINHTFLALILIYILILRWITTFCQYNYPYRHYLMSISWQYAVHVRQNLKTSPRETSNYQCHQHLLLVLRPKIPTELISIHFHPPLKLRDITILICQLRATSPWLMRHTTIDILP